MILIHLTCNVCNVHFNRPLTMWMRPSLRPRCSMCRISASVTQDKRKVRKFIRMPKECPFLACHQPVVTGHQNQEVKLLSTFRLANLGTDGKLHQNMLFQKPEQNSCQGTTKLCFFFGAELALILVSDLYTLIMSDRVHTRWNVFW